MTTFDERLVAYRLIRAQILLSDIEDDRAELAGQRPAYDAEACERLATAHAAALNDLLLTPARKPFDLATKLKIAAEEDIAAGWRLGREICAMIACDAQRLLVEA